MPSERASGGSHDRCVVGRSLEGAQQGVAANAELSGEVGGGAGADGEMHSEDQQAGGPDPLGIGLGVRACLSVWRRDRVMELSALAV